MIDNNAETTRRTVIKTSGLAVALGLSGCLGSADAEDTGPRRAQDRGGVEFAEHSPTHDNGEVGIRGVIENTSDRSYDYVGIVSVLYDEDMNHIAKTSDGIVDLGSGGSEEFTTSYGGSEDEFYGYQLGLTDI